MTSSAQTLPWKLKLRQVSVPASQLGAQTVLKAACKWIWEQRALLCCLGNGQSARVY